MKQEHEFKEIWLPLLHLAHHKDNTPMYEVSNTGHIRMKTINGYKPVKQHINPDGYHTVSLVNAIFMRQSFYVHRLVGVTFCKNIFGWDTIDHIDNNKSNNNASNLRWVSRGTNISFAHRDGLIVHKPKHPVKLTNGNREICFETMSKAAIFLGCSIHAILAGLKGQFNPKGWSVSSLIPKEVNGNLFNDSDF